LLQQLVDQVAGFNLFALPEMGRADAGICLPGDSKSLIGFRVREAIHRFDIGLKLPSLKTGLRASNLLGEVAGRLDLRWLVVPYDFMARPDQEPPPTLLDPSRSQRFVMREATFTFGDGRGGLRSFGTGRTFPVLAGGQPKLLAAAVGNITEGFGEFRGHEGNFTLCGEWVPRRGFLGHVLVRVLDPERRLRTQCELPPLQERPDPDPGTTFLMWAAQKGKGADQENRFSIAPDGGVRGMNIPTQLKRLYLGCAAEEAGCFRCSDFRTGEVIGREVGFGRGAQPEAPPTGTAVSPYLFEGVARYSFHDEQGNPVGAITTNVLEGRRFDVRLPDAPGEPALRFGFFGPIIFGSGCFRGAEGFFYGSSGSVFKPPPADHVITHFYMARLNDPEGRYRANLNAGPH
jgi:hypothetical protein